jgi:signal peptidase I
LAESASRKQRPAPAPAAAEARPPLKGARPRRTNGKQAPAEGRDDGAMEWVKSLGGAILLFFVIRTFLVTAYSIPSESMERSLLVGDYLMANNALFGATLPFTEVKLPSLRDPRRGEIVVFRPEYNEPRIDVVKRVIGVPGDTLRMENQVLYRNGERVDEPYASYQQGFDTPISSGGAQLMDPTVRTELYGAQNHVPLLVSGVEPSTYSPTRNSWGPLVIPDGHYWFMGDNRYDSIDSRFYGFVPRKNIRGRPLFVYYSYNADDSDRALPMLTDIRWSRIFTVIR